MLLLFLILLLLLLFPLTCQSCFLDWAVSLITPLKDTPQPHSQPHLVAHLLHRLSACQRNTSQSPLFAFCQPFMPLSEISANVRRNGIQAQTTHKTSRGQSPDKIKRDVVSSMLRTATETGDVGQFSSRPSRLPRSTSRLPAPSRSSSLNPPATSLRQSTRRPIPRYDSRRLPRPVPSFSALSRQDTVRSNLTSSHTDPRTRYRGAPRAPYGFDRRPSPATSGLYSHSSFATLRGRPGYRPVSPACSDAQSMPTYNRGPGFHRAASVATAASSPASMFNPDAPYFYRDFNQSASSLSRFPSPAMPGAYPGMRRSPFPSRNATPVSASLHYPTRHPNGSLESFHTMHRSVTGSTIPVYYDYTEAFEGDFCHFPAEDVGISPLFSADHTIPEQEPARHTRQAQTPFGMMEGSVFKPCEMPTHHNRTHSEESKQEFRESQMVQKANQAEISDIPEDSGGKAESSLASDSQQAAGSTLTSDPITAERMSQSLQQQPQETDSRRASAVSRRTFPASPSTAFFPNATRNSRDLTSLAARVHSPTPNSTSGKDTEIMDEGGKIDDSKISLSTDKGVSDVWQLPSLDFTPMSFLHYSQGAAERPRSSGPIMRSNRPTIISPTPERPMSSLSRRRFSKILGLDENGCSPVRGPKELPRSYNSLNVGKLKRVLESPETSYPARYSIPAFSPRNSMIAASSQDNESVGSADHEQGSGCEKSTVESLLDKHIDCLGLRPETASEPLKDQKVLGDDDTQASMASTSRDEDTIKITLRRASPSRLRAQTVSSPNESGTASSQQNLVPRKLFSPDDLKEARLAAAQSNPCISKHSLHGSSGRQSLGWEILASTSHIPLDDPRPSQRAIEQPQPEPEEESLKGEGKQLAATRFSPSASSRWSGKSDDLYNWNDEVSPKLRSRQRALERQISQRRRTRMRLKLKRNSQSHGRICASELSSAHGSFHTARAPSQDRISVLEPLARQDTGTIESHPTVDAGTHSQHTAQNAPSQQASKLSPQVTTPDTPKARSSVVAIATQRVKKSVDVARKMSVKTMRSHRSNVSIVEPLNSTRLSAVAPHLKPPDLGPPLTPMSMSLNMEFAFPPAAVTRPAGLRATQSFFSDDSSAVQNHRGSLRKRFNLPSLRSVLPSSPRAHSMISVPGRSNQAGPSRLHQSCHLQGLKQQEEEEDYDLYGTPGMSDFAYCRRRMLERVKGWWRRQCVQRKLGLRRRRGEQDVSPGD
jgi:hypothetical protein